MEKEKKQKPVKERKNSKKVTSSKNNGLGVRKKITLAMSGLIMAFVLLLGYLAMKAVNYSERYSSVLDNITKITYIKKNCADLAPSLVNMCNFYSEVDDDTKERIQKINDYYDDYKFGYYYVPNDFEYYYPDSENSNFKNEEFNTFVASAYYNLNRGYGSGQGNKIYEIINDWYVYTY